jgi:hypothetical protein
VTDDHIPFFISDQLPAYTHASLTTSGLPDTLPLIFSLAGSCLWGARRQQ